MGLAIVKAMVEAHAGRVEAQRAGVGQGSTFVVKLPIPSSEKKKPSLMWRRLIDSIYSSGLFDIVSIVIIGLQFEKGTGNLGSKSLIPVTAKIIYP